MSRAVCFNEALRCSRARTARSGSSWRSVAAEEDFARHAMAATAANLVDHVLPDVPAVVDKAGEGIPSLALDFKLLFTVACDELYYRLGFEAKRRCFLLPGIR